VSNEVLKIPTDAKSVDLFILNNNKFQYIRNSNYRFVGMGSLAIPYFELKPDEILVYSCPYFKKGEKEKQKSGLPMRNQKNSKCLLMKI
jgi:hypothetical protein